jgi:MFS family permease
VSRGSLVRDRDFGLLVGAVWLSAAGDFVAIVPLALHVQERTASGPAVAALFIALWLPVVLLAGHAGLIVDRLNARKLLAVMSCVQAAIAVGLAFSSALTPILVLTALLGTCFAVSQPAEFALVPAVAGRERLGEANGYVETARYVGFTVGPLLGGALAASGGMRLAMLVNAASFVALAVAALVIRARFRAADEADEPSGAGRARDGIAFLLREPGLRLVMVALFVQLVFMSTTIPAEVFFVKDVLGAGDLGYGGLLAIWTLGMAVGALILARRVRPAHLVAGTLAAIVVQGLGLGLPPLWLSLTFLLAVSLVGGLGHGLKNTLARTLIHERVPDRLHGRAFAAYNGLRNGAEMAALAGGGVLVALIGARWTLLIAGWFPIAIGLAALAVHRRMRRDAIDVPEAAGVPVP